MLGYIFSGLFIFVAIPFTSVMVAWAQLGGAFAAILALLLAPAWWSAGLCLVAPFQRHATLRTV
jgi:hypothetical protein